MIEALDPSLPPVDRRLELLSDRGQKPCQVSDRGQRPEPGPVTLRRKQSAQIPIAEKDCHKLPWNTRISARPCSDGTAHRGEIDAPILCSEIERAGCRSVEPKPLQPGGFLFVLKQGNQRAVLRP